MHAPLVFLAVDRSSDFDPEGGQRAKIDIVAAMLSLREESRRNIQALCYAFERAIRFKR